MRTPAQGVRNIVRFNWTPDPAQVSVETIRLSADDDSDDLVFLIRSVHEIRDADEQGRFFRQLHRILKANGKIVMIEHLRDVPNFLAFTV